MGPYCRYCNNRCFVPFPQGTPEHILKAYRPGVTIIATCPGGQAFEKEKTGYNYDKITEEMNNDETIDQPAKEGKEGKKEATKGDFKDRENH